MCDRRTIYAPCYSSSCGYMSNTNGSGNGTWSPNSTYAYPPRYNSSDPFIYPNGSFSYNYSNPFPTNDNFSSSAPSFNNSWQQPFYNGSYPDGSYNGTWQDPFFNYTYPLPVFNETIHLPQPILNDTFLNCSNSCINVTDVETCNCTLPAVLPIPIPPPEIFPSINVTDLWGNLTDPTGNFTAPPAPGSPGLPSSPALPSSQAGVPPAPDAPALPGNLSEPEANTTSNGTIFACPIPIVVPENVTETIANATEVSRPAHALGQCAITRPCIACVLPCPGRCNATHAS